MKVTIVTFEPEIKHLPIVVKGGHGEAVNHLNSKYDFSYLLPVGAWPYLELQEHPSLSYLASVQIIGGGKFVPVAKLNTVTLIEPNNQSEEEFRREARAVIEAAIRTVSKTQGKYPELFQAVNEYLIAEETAGRLDSADLDVWFDENDIERPTGEEETDENLYTVTLKNWDEKTTELMVFAWYTTMDKATKDAKRLADKHAEPILVVSGITGADLVVVEPGQEGE